MTRSYDKERLLEKIMSIYDADFSDRDKYEELRKLVDDDIDTLKIKKARLEKLVASIQYEGLFITYELTTNISDEGHDGDGTIWIDLSISIEDVAEFIEWLQKTVKNTKSITNQDDIENFLRGYLSDHKVNFGNIGLRVSDYNVN